MVSYLDAALAPPKNTGQIRLYGRDAFDGMMKAGQLTARCLDELASFVQPGVTTNAIDRFVFEYGADHGALPATLNYRGYTKSSCTSINHVVCHGIPDDKPLREGDIVNIDVTFVLDGWHGDSSRMYPVGKVSRAAERLMEVTYECLRRGIAAVRPGAKTGAIVRRSRPMPNVNAARWCAIFAATASGRSFMMHPTYCITGAPNEGVEMREGMIFTIEPMINLGRPHVKVLADAGQL